MNRAWRQGNGIIWKAINKEKNWRKSQMKEELNDWKIWRQMIKIDWKENGYSFLWKNFTINFFFIIFWVCLKNKKILKKMSLNWPAKIDL